MFAHKEYRKRKSRTQRLYKVAEVQVHVAVINKSRILKRVVIDKMISVKNHQKTQNKQSIDTEDH